MSILKMSIPKMSIPIMSTVPNVYSHYVYCAKMSIPKMSTILKKNIDKWGKNGKNISKAEF